MGLCCIVSKLIQLGLNQIWCSNFSLQRISRKKHRSIWKCKLPVVLCCHYSWDSIEAWNQWRYSITVQELCTRALIYSEIADSAHCVLLINNHNIPYFCCVPSFFKWPYQLANKWVIILLLLWKLAVVESKLWKKSMQNLFLH